MDHEILVTDPHLFYEVDFCVTPIHYPKYNISPSNSLQDMKQNHSAIKQRSLTYIYLMRTIFVSHCSIIPTMMFIHHVDLYIYFEVNVCVTLSHYLKI